MLKLDRELDPPAGDDLGPTRHAVRAPDGALLVVSRLGLLGTPGRLLGGRSRWRAALYDGIGGRARAVLDSLRYPVNDVAFDLRTGKIALATGSYDGGYHYEGEVVVWSPGTGDVHRPLRESREVVRCRWLDDGNLAVRLRPPCDEDPVVDEGRVLGAAGETVVPLDAVGLAGERAPLDEALGDEVARVTAPRAVVRDAAWTPGGVAFALASGHVEVWSARGEKLRTLALPGEPIQLLGPWVHVLVAADVSVRLPAATLLRHGPQLSTLVDLASGECRARFPSTYSMSRARDGTLLARDAAIRGPRADLLLGPDGAVLAELELGHADPLNHYLRIDGEEALHFIEGAAGPEWHRRKRFRSIDPRTRARRDLGAWDDGVQATASDAIAVGDGWLRGFQPFAWGKTESPRLERRRRDWTVAWSRELTAAPSAVCALGEHDVAVVAQLDGRVLVVELGTGTTRASLDLDVPVTALAWAAPLLALGTADGRRRLYRW